MRITDHWGAAEEMTSNKLKMVEVLTIIEKNYCLTTNKTKMYSLVLIKL